MKLTDLELQEFLDAKYHQYNSPEFIHSDPISIPHKFHKKEDIEISGFLTATLSWGQREMIIKKANILMEMMDNAPYQFILQADEQQLQPFKNFCYRTFNGDDTITFIHGLQNIYRKQGGLEQLITRSSHEEPTIKKAIIELRHHFFSENLHLHAEKHLANPAKGSAAKRINMFLRWMVREDDYGVDFGLWKNISTHQLIIPLDLHVARTARFLGLLHRKSNDWKAAEELTQNLKSFSAEDPVKYDFALFGSSIFEKISSSKS